MMQVEEDLFTTMEVLMKAVLDKLGIEEVNPGACTGPDGWITDPHGKELVSYNPTTNEPIASIIQATGATYEQVVMAARRAFLSWRMVPAPKRGEVVRDFGERLASAERTIGRPGDPGNGQDPG